MAIATSSRPDATTAGKPKRDWLAELQRDVKPKPTAMVVYGPPGIGKCLGKGTPILMFDGTIKAVENVVDGELVMGPDSGPRLVSGVTSGQEMLYRVSPVKGDSYVVNESHILSLKMSVSASGFQAGAVANVSVSQWLNASNTFRHYAKGWRTAINFPPQPVPLDPYVLGVWLADGTAAKPDVTTPDEEVVGAMREYAASVGMAVKRVCSSGKATTYSINGGLTGGTVPNALTAALRQLGVVNNKHIPQAYLSNSQEVRLATLAGILDGDGYLVNNCFEIATIRESLCRGILFLARSLGLAAYARLKEKQCVNNGKWGHYWCIVISGDIDKIPVRIPRRKPSARLQKKNVLVTGITLTPEGVGDYYGFSVDGDGLFVLGDFTVTHNTSLGSAAPAPVFLIDNQEDGIGTLKASRLVAADIPVLPACSSWEDVGDALAALHVGDHKFKTLVIDTLGGMERLLHEYVCRTEFKGEWGEKGFSSYARGYEVSLPPWREFLNRLDRLRNDRNMSVVGLAHSHVRPFKNPEGEDFDRYIVDMHPKTWAVTHKFADLILFANYYVQVEKERGAARAKGKGGQLRFFNTEYTAAYDAKNRHGLPPEIPMGDSGQQAWDNLVTAIKEARKDK